MSKFKHEHNWHIKNIDPENHKINFGNHDDTTFLNKPHSTGNYSYDKETGIFTIRGAESIDRIYRVEGRDWWANEELGYDEMIEAIFAYDEIKPKIVVSHDCPHETRKMFYGIQNKCITCNGLQSMWERHKPDLWIYGHHHFSEKRTVLGTEFVCLNELETLVI